MLEQLSDLLNLSFTTGVFPSVLKTAKVVPIFKKNSKLDYSNYGPISLLSNIKKKNLKDLYIRDYIPFSTTILSITYHLNLDNILHLMS